MYKELNKFPFTESSTLILTSLNYMLPLDIIVDANFYPRCSNSAPFYISEIIKKDGEVLLSVNNNINEPIFIIVIPITLKLNNKYFAGYGMQGGVYCGSCLCTETSIDFFKSIPTITDIDPDSLVFSATAIRPIVDHNVIGSGDLLYEGNRVKHIAWGENLEGGTITTKVINTQQEEQETQAITEVVVNGITLSGDNLFITPSKQGVIRVINSSDINIGRITDL